MSKASHNNIVAIGFFAIIPRNFAREWGSWFKRLGIFVDIFVKPPFETTRTLPKLDGIILTFVEESLSLLSIAAECDCSGCTELSNMRFAEWIESVMMTIFEMLSLQHAWLMPHLIAKSSASELVTKTAWWIVLMRGELAWWTCAIEVAMLSLMLASVTTIVDEGEEFKRTKLSSSWAWVVIFSFLSTKLKEKRSGKMFEIRWPGVNSWWRGSNNGKIP